jgi:hypothetical protein
MIPTKSKVIFGFFVAVAVVYILSSSFLLAQGTGLPVANDWMLGVGGATLSISLVFLGASIYVLRKQNTSTKPVEIFPSDASDIPPESDEAV